MGNIQFSNSFGNPSYYKHCFFYIYCKHISRFDLAKLKEKSGNYLINKGDYIEDPNLVMGKDLIQMYLTESLEDYSINNYQGREMSILKRIGGQMLDKFLHRDTNRFLMEENFKTRLFVTHNSDEKEIV